MRVAVAALLYVALPLALAAEGTDCTLEDQEFDWTIPPQTRPATFFGRAQDHHPVSAGARLFWSTIA